jgi:hypothetical protein
LPLHVIELKARDGVSADRRPPRIRRQCQQLANLGDLGSEIAYATDEAERIHRSVCVAALKFFAFQA